MKQLAETDVQSTSTSLIDGMLSTRTIRRYTDDPVPDHVLRDIFFAATRAPSGSNRQPFRFLVLRSGPLAVQAKQLIAEGAQAAWDAKRARDGYDAGSGSDHGTAKARFAVTMQHYVDHFASTPILVLACLNRYRAPEYTEGASVYPACQNLLLAARAYGYGGAMTMFHNNVDAELRALLAIPQSTALCATITIGRPAGRHGAVRRLPLQELVFEETWEQPAPWASDPPGTTFTSAGPPPSRPI